MSDKQKEFGESWIIFAGVLIALGVVAIFIPWNTLNGWPPNSSFQFAIPEYDELGTYIYNICAPFIGLATIVLLWRTYTLQHEQLAEQKAQSKEQTNSIARQRFEGIFFQLINTHNQIVNAIDLRDKKTKEIVAVKRDCFKIMQKNFVDLSSLKKAQSIEDV